MERMARLASGLGLGRHPLHRRCDTLEARMLAGLLAVLLVCGPLLAVAAFRLAERAGLSPARDWLRAARQPGPRMPPGETRMAAREE